MENKVFEKNLYYIEKYNKNLAERLLRINLEKTSISITKTTSNEYNLLYKNTFIHSNQGIEQENKRIVSKIEDCNNSIRIIYGLGLGYLVDSMAQKIKKGKVFVFEPDIELIAYVLSIAQIDAIENKNVYLFNKEDELYSAINESCDCETTLTMSFLDSYKQLFFNDINKVFNQAQNILGEKIINKNTLSSKSSEAISYSIKNLHRIINNPDIFSLEGVYKGKTALIVSAGPSLAQYISLIKNNQDKFVIFAVNRTLNLLIENSITPDFVVNIETIDTLRQYRGIDTKELCFIVETFTNPKIHNIQTKKTFNYICNDNFLNPWIRECLNIKNNLQTIGTVTYSALLSAYLMGFEKIILIGSDLAFKNGDCYSKAQGWYEELECVFNNDRYTLKPKNPEAFLNSFKNDKTKAKEYINKLNRNLCTVQSQEGKPIPSRIDYSYYINHLKNFASNNKNCEFINCSTKGAQIDGFKNIPLEEVIKTLESIEKIDIKNYTSSYNKTYALEKINSGLVELKSFLKAVKNTIAISKKLESELSIKKIETKNAISLSKKQKNCLLELFSYKNSKLTAFFVYQIKNSSFDKLLITLVEIEKSVEEIINNLANCKSFIA